MRKLALAAIMLTVLSGCAPVEPLPGVPTGECSNKGLGDFINKRANPDVLAQARKRSGASVVRVIRPGQMVTMEYRNGRLNANVDDRNSIKGFTCG